MSIQLAFVPHYIDVAIRSNIIDAFVFTSPQPDNSHYQTWLTNSDSGSVPIMFGIQFFNITNPRQVLLGQPPQLNITGPLVYNQYFYRRDVNFSGDGYWVNHTFFTEYLYVYQDAKIKIS